MTRVLIAKLPLVVALYLLGPEVRADDPTRNVVSQEKNPAGNWPQWRGPDRSGISRDTGLLQTWPEGGPPLFWKATGLGSSVTSLSVAAGRIFTLGTFDDQEHLLALKETDGTLLWKARIGPATKSLPVMQWLSQRTPTCDPAGDLVYGFSARGILVCCEASTGKELWRKDYYKDFAGRSAAWGFCDYPLVDGDKLICTPGGDTSTIVALDKRKGTILWQCPIEGERNSYGAIVPFEVGKKRYYVQQMNKGAVAISAEGKLVWKGFPEVGNGTGNVQTTLVRDNLLFFANGWVGRCGVVKVSEGKDGIKVETQYSTKHMFDQWLGSAVLIGDKVLTSCGRCLEFATGKSLHKTPIEINPRGVMTWADGRSIFRKGDNTILLMEMTDAGYVQRGKFELPKSTAYYGWSFPIVTGGKLYLRDQDLLYCYDLRQKSDRPRTPDAIFVPTPQDVVEKMLDLAKVKKTDRVYDLGCGDGRIVVTAAGKFGCKAVGVDIDPECVQLSLAKVAKEKLEALVTIEQRDLFTVDLSTADVVTLYLLPKLNVKLLPQLEKLKPGARVVSHAFPMEGIEPHEVVRYRSTEDGVEHTLYLWTAPLKKK